MNRIEGFGEVCMSAPTSDWNTACGTRSGFYMGADMSNSPNGSTVAGWWWVIHLAHNNLYQRQIAFSFLNNSQMFTRIMNNGTWNNWTLINQAMVTTDANEVATGRRIDDADEYVKRYSFDSINSAGTYTADLGFTLADVTITKIDGVAYSSSNNWFPITIGDFNNQIAYAINVWARNSDNKLVLETANANFRKAFIEVSYILNS